MSWDFFFEYFNWTSIGSSIIFGWLTGAFYGFELNPKIPIHWPYRLWLVGLGFVVLLAVNNMLESNVPIEFAYARAALWTILCSFLPLGRLSRLWWEHWQIGQRLKRVRRRNGH